MLIDEVNRATPKTQSALLEAMEENHVTIDGVTHPLPEPFFVIATQNPQQQIGTFPLPESQLDRFLMRIELGVPDRAAERTMLLGLDRREMVRDLKPVRRRRRRCARSRRAVRSVHTVARAARLFAGFARCQPAAGIAPASRRAPGSRCSAPRRPGR